MMIGQNQNLAKMAARRPPVARGASEADRSVVRVVGSNEGRREPVDEGCSMEASSEEDEDDEPLSQEERLALSAFACAERGDAAELRRLAGRGVELGMVDEGGCSLAHEAAAGGQAGVVRLLGETTGDVLQRVRATLGAQEAELGWTPFHAAASQGHAECIEALAQITDDPATSIWLTRDREGGTPLHVAAMAGHVTAVRALLATLPEGAGEGAWSAVAARDHSDLTALHSAIIEGRAEVNFFQTRGSLCTHTPAH